MTGDLLSLAASEFDVFVTVDKDLPAEQNVAAFDIAVIVLRARSTRLVDLRKVTRAVARNAPDDTTG